MKLSSLFKNASCLGNKMYRPFEAHLKAVGKKPQCSIWKYVARIVIHCPLTIFCLSQCLPTLYRAHLRDKFPGIPRLFSLSAAAAARPQVRQRPSVSVGQSPEPLESSVRPIFGSCRIYAVSAVLNIVLAISIGKPIFGIFADIIGRYADKSSSWRISYRPICKKSYIGRTLLESKSKVQKHAFHWPHTSRRPRES